MWKIFLDKVLFNSSSYSGLITFYILQLIPSTSVWISLISWSQFVLPKQGGPTYARALTAL